MKVHRVLPKPDEYAWTFGGEEARATIAPGDVVELFTEDCFGGRIQNLDDLPSRRITFPYINPQTGPFHVEGPSRATRWRSTSSTCGPPGTGR